MMNDAQSFLDVFARIENVSKNLYYLSIELATGNSQDYKILKLAMKDLQTAEILLACDVDKSVKNQSQNFDEKIIENFIKSANLIAKLNREDEIIGNFLRKIDSEFDFLIKFTQNYQRNGVNENIDQMSDAGSDIDMDKFEMSLQN